MNPTTSFRFPYQSHLLNACPNSRAKREWNESTLSHQTNPLHFSFSSSKYAAARPRYTTALLDEIMRYHGRRSIRSAELGCGPGTITSYLAAHSDWVLATDPSEQMIREAGKGLAGADNVQLREASAGELPSLLTEPVDLIVSAQAAHWFHSPPNHTADCKLWELLGDALTSRGSLVYLVSLAAHSTNLILSYLRSTETYNSSATHISTLLPPSKTPAPLTGSSPVAGSSRISSETFTFLGGE